MEANGIIAIPAVLPTRGMIFNDKFDLSNKAFQEFSQQDAIAAYTATIEFLREAGFPTPDLYEAVLKSDKQFTYLRETHWNHDGAQHIAKALADVIKTLPEYQQIPKEDFESFPANIDSILGNLSQPAMKACPGLSIPPESEQRFETKRVSEPIAQGLFDDTTPPVILFGTSNSVSSNFAGFLEDALEL